MFGSPSLCFAPYPLCLRSPCDLGIAPANITYVTIDAIRQERHEYIEMGCSVDAVVVIAGATVPGRYLGGRPISSREISELAVAVGPVPLILGGPIVLFQGPIPGVSLTCGEIAATSLQSILGGRPEPDGNTSESWTERIARFAVLGAELTTRHPSFPYVVCELETFRGCPRHQNCAFCSEGKNRSVIKGPSLIFWRKWSFSQPGQPLLSPWLPV